MKQIILSLGILSLSAFVQYSVAQSSGDLAINYRTSKSPAASSEKKEVKAKVTGFKSKMIRDFIYSNKNLVEVPTSEVSTKAVRNFLYSHQQVQDVKWFRSANGFVAGYNAEGEETKVVYDAGGRWFYDLHSYNESKLPYDVRDLVKSKYYDNDIIVVYQYDFENKTVYMIRLCDKNSNITTLTVSNGEIENITSSQNKQ